MDTPFMATIARGVAAEGIRVIRFEFAYMAARRHGKKGGAPDREPVLLARWREVVAQQGGGENLVIGGKSMGGRMASMVADELQVAGLVCLGYPFHPPGQPGKLRTAHLASLRTTTLIVQGERDPFGTSAEVPGYELSKSIRVEWIPDGDHSFRPRARAGLTEKETLQRATEFVVSFVTSV